MVKLTEVLKRIFELIKRNRADVYIQFLIGFMIFVVFVSLLIMLAEYQILTSKIISEVEQTSDEVLAEIKKDYYGDYIITDKNLNITDTVIADSTLINKLCNKLGAEKQTNKICKTLNGQTKYELTNITYTNDDNSIYLNAKISIPITINGKKLFDYHKDLSFASGLSIKEYATD